MRRCRSEKRRVVAGVVFVFPGQGSQWRSMGRALLAESPVFAQAIAACETALSRYTDWSLTSVLRGDESVEASLLERVDVIQPALFAMNVALAAVWRSLGRGAVGGGGSQPGRDRSRSGCRDPEP